MSRPFRNYAKVSISISSLSEVAQAIELINRSGFSGKIAAIIHYEEDRKTLESLGIDSIYNFYAQAGSGFAKSVNAEIAAELSSNEQP